MEEGGPPDANASAGRIFQDGAGRRWRANFSSADGESVLEFTCLEESREPSRAMAVASGFSFTGISDQSLRNWLAGAPRLGRLTE
jgi:hypothetical protein